MIEALSGFPEGTLAFICHGQVTKDDYASTIAPEVDKAAGGHDKIRLYYEIGRDFSGIEPSAILEDFKVGMGHLGQWERIAVVTDVDWIKLTAQGFGLFMPGKVRVFPTEESGVAKSWITAA
ncbi:MAG: STAS/SEC14 domain-containing protein [Methylovirgula sp.]